MGGMVVCLAATVLGVDVGWQRMDDGQWEVIVQIEPELLEEMLRAGEAPGDLVAAGIPPQLRGVRRYRIRVGTGPVPREEGELPPVELTSERKEAEERPSEASPNAANAGEFEPGQGYSPPSVPGYSPPPIPFPEPKPGPTQPPELGVGELPGEQAPASDGLGQGPTAEPGEPAESPPESPLESQGAGARAPSGPQELVVDPGAKQLPVRPALHLEPSASPSDRTTREASAEPPSEAPEPTPAEPTGRPWLPLTLALLGLSGSLGANAWLLWIARDFRSRYRTLLAERDTASGSA